MKKYFAYAGIFLLAYLTFVLATLPAQFVVSKLSLPKNVGIYGVSGTIWQGSIEQLVITNTQIQKVNSQLSFLSLFTLTPKVDLTFGDAILAGPEGQLTLAVSADELALTNVDVLIPANTIAQQIALPLPITAKGNVEVQLTALAISLGESKQCTLASGELSWRRAGVIALEQNIKLGKLSADIGCEQGAIAVNLAPKNNLGLTFSAYIRDKGKISGQGHLKPGAKFPEQLKSALPFLGKADNQGRYRISI